MFSNFFSCFPSNRNSSNSQQQQQGGGDMMLDLKDNSNGGGNPFVGVTSLSSPFYSPQQLLPSSLLSPPATAMTTANSSSPSRKVVMQSVTTNNNNITLPKISPFTFLFSQQGSEAASMVEDTIHSIMAPGIFNKSSAALFTIYQLRNPLATDKFYKRFIKQVATSLSREDYLHIRKIIILEPGLITDLATKIENPQKIESCVKSLVFAITTLSATIPHVSLYLDFGNNFILCDNGKVGMAVDVCNLIMGAVKASSSSAWGKVRGFSINTQAGRCVKSMEAEDSTPTLGDDGKVLLPASSFSNTFPAQEEFVRSITKLMSAYDLPKNFLVNTSTLIIIPPTSSSTLNTPNNATGEAKTPSKLYELPMNLPLAAPAPMLDAYIWNKFVNLSPVSSSSRIQSVTSDL